ncbi:MAG: DEAD/DEAH box helicase [Legionellales bacterium]|nr:DEAD/DEAH box helicase [Legionellales bacterium]
MNNFETLGLAPSLLTALTELGFTTPSPVQEHSIPILLANHNLLGQAQTGTGKTAAFGLPILTKLDLSSKKPQALILTPTRELALQVAEALQSYAKHMAGFQVAAIYGGQSYYTQMKSLERGVHIIVGTPGRLMDLIRRGKVDFSQLKTLVLDEADEMLNMGFIDDVEWILEQIPTEHQTALFSATMSPAIQKVVDKYIPQAKKVKIQAKTETASTIEQMYTIVPSSQKLEALTRFLEWEEFDGILIFTRTKMMCSELAEKLAACGYFAAAINGDLSQDLREKVISRLKNKTLDIVVATEVAARGLDVDRISHVINYDIPFDPESYIHRIGRTGRAGRAGKAILFVEPRERRLLSMIERITKQPLVQVNPPSLADLSQKRIEKFTKQIHTTLTQENLTPYRELICKITEEQSHSALDIASALAFLSKKINFNQKFEQDPLAKKHHASDFHPAERSGKKSFSRQESRGRDRFTDDSDLVRCRIDVGREHGLQPSDVVGLIANRSGVKRNAIGRISIQATHSFVDVSSEHLQKIIKATFSVKLKKQQFGIKPIQESGSFSQNKNKKYRERA